MDPATDQHVRSLRQRLEIYDALVAAADRRREVFEVVEAAPNGEVAIAHLVELLTVAELGARAVMDMQLRRLTVDERSRIRAWCEAARRELESL